METWHGNDAAEHVTLRLQPGRLPQLEIRQGNVTRYRTTSLTQVLKLLDRSLILEQMQRETMQRTALPTLPPRTLLVTTEETAQHLDVLVTAWMPPVEVPFVLEESVYLIHLPHLVYQMRWRREESRILHFRLAVTLSEPVALTTDLYRWPFSNVMHGEAVCWSARNYACPLADVEKGVWGFLQTPNNTHGFGLGKSHNGPQGSDYARFLTDVQEQGLCPQWLVPLGKTLAEFHNEP